MAENALLNSTTPYGFRHPQPRAQSSARTSQNWPENGYDRNLSAHIPKLMHLTHQVL